MLKYGKMSQTAIAIVSRLAEIYSPNKTVLTSSLDIAKDKSLSKPLVAKIMTMLSQAGLITGSPGPNGGYKLSKHPKHISLLDVISLFEGITNNKPQCPLGGSLCRQNEPCPLHHKFTKIENDADKFLNTTRFDIFLVKK